MSYKKSYMYVGVVNNLGGDDNWLTAATVFLIIMVLP